VVTGVQTCALPISRLLLAELTTMKKRGAYVYGSSVK